MSQGLEASRKSESPPPYRLKWSRGVEYTSHINPWEKDVHKFRTNLLQTNEIKNKPLTRSFRE